MNVDYVLLNSIDTFTIEVSFKKCKLFTYLLLLFTNTNFNLLFTLIDVLFVCFFFFLYYIVKTHFVFRFAIRITYMYCSGPLIQYYK